MSKVLLPIVGATLLFGCGGGGGALGGEITFNAQGPTNARTSRLSNDVYDFNNASGQYDVIVRTGPTADDRRQITVHFDTNTETAGHQVTINGTTNAVVYEDTPSAGQRRVFEAMGGTLTIVRANGEHFAFRINNLLLQPTTDGDVPATGTLVLHGTVSR